MEKTKQTIPEQVKKALDGRSQRWLSLKVAIPETELSKKMNGAAEFSEEEIKRVNEVLKSKIKL